MRRARGAGRGLVVGTILDLSATYYNPGAVAATQQSSLVLTLRSTLLGQAVDQSDMGYSARGVDEFYYWNLRALWKVGVAVDLAPLTPGVTATTPGITLVGEGELLTNYGLTADTGATVNEIEANCENKIPSTYKSPPSVALGASYRLGTTRLYGTAELFGKVDAYTVLDSRSFVGQTTGDTIAVDLTHSLRSVFNWGWVWSWGSVNAGISTDRSSPTARHSRKAARVPWPFRRGISCT